MPSQRPYFLSSVFAAFRQQTPTIQAPSTSTSTSQHQQQQQQQHKHHSTSAATSTTTPPPPTQTSPAGATSTSTSSSASHYPQTAATTSTSSNTSSGPSTSSPRPYSTVAAAAAAAAAAKGGTSVGSSAVGSMPIPAAGRRGSDSSSEGFRDVLGADKWYIGGRTAAGEEKFFKMGVVRRVRSNDGLSLDRLSL